MLITVSATSDDREECALIANTLVEVFLAAQKEVAKGRLRETATALRSSLVAAEGDLRKARSAYAEFRTKHQISDVSVETEAAITELARLRVQANDAQVELETLRVRETSLRASRDKTPAKVVASRNEQEPAVVRLSESKARLAEAQATLTPEHPKVRALEAEVEALQLEVSSGKPVVTSRVVTRSALRDNLAGQVEELTALRKSIEQRKTSLDEVLVTAQKRASALTTAESEAARLLANVQVAEKHVSSLLGQIATAEDDVRKATSDFQVVSQAAAPAWSEKGKGKLIAVGGPVVALLLGVLFVLVRALLPLRAWAASEIAFFGGGPVLWATNWPDASADEARSVSRELADALEPLDGVVGFTSLHNDHELTPQLADLVAERLRLRGLSCAVVDLRRREPPSNELTLADVLEGREVGREIEDARSANQLVLVLIPPLEQLDVVRAARRWVDALIVVVISGRASPKLLLSIRKAVGIDSGSLAYIGVKMPPWLLSPATRVFGTLEFTTSWKSSAPPRVALRDGEPGGRAKRTSDT